MLSFTPSPNIQWLTNLRLGDAFQARATRAPHRATLRCLGLSAGIAIAACAPTKIIHAYACAETHPGWRTPISFTYVGRAITPGGDCLYVTDTEGWNRRLCNSGPDQFTCRATVFYAPTAQHESASGIETEGHDPQGYGAKHESPTAESGDAHD